MRRILVTMTLCAAMANLGGCVLAVGNGIDDGSSWSSEHSDTTLARAVRASYEADPALREADLKVSAEHGRVYLEGTVHSAETLTRAVQVALDTPEVKSVRCRVVVIR
ncbi:MAG TPA: BON domain-containing protein [Gammaproteobacteria bacterium]